MKKFVRYLLVCFLFVGLFIFSKQIKIFAKVSTSSVFEIEVGNEKLPLYYNLVNSQIVYDGIEEVGSFESGIISMNNGKTFSIKENKVFDEVNNEVGSLNESVLTINAISYTLGDVSVKEKIIFNVSLKGLSDSSNSYRWEHTFCYKIEGLNEICETDFTGKDQGDGSQNILSNNTYNFSFWDGHMPYYSEYLVFEYVKFSNKFVSLEEGSSQEIILDDIVFSSLSDEISYFYNYNVELNEKEVDSKYYIGASNTSAALVNNTSSTLKLEGAPEYKFINEVCVSNDNCDVFETDTVYRNNSPLKITPYLGNINFSYNNSYFAKKDTDYEYITLKTSLECIANCSSRRIENATIVVFEKKYNFDYKAPIVDEENTVISSIDAYVKSVNIKIEVKDVESGVNLEKLIYRLGWNNNGSCSFTNEVFYYENGIEFELGPNLKDGAICMYYTATDNLGNQTKSNDYYFYFDNNGPSLTVNIDDYVDTNYYDQVDLEVSVADSYSGMDKSYYLWSKEKINESDYLLVQENGILYDNNGIISSLGNVNSDGIYYLYVVSYDLLGNYTFYDGGSYNLDITSLLLEEVSVSVSNMDGYSNVGKIKIDINEVDDEEEFKCGFFEEQKNVLISDLNLTCKNNKDISLPSNLEGEYSLWIYAHDKANNYSLLNIKDALLIDTKGPIISYDILKDDDNYHITNEITLSVSDLNGVNTNSLKYGWFVASKTNVISDDLNNDFVNGQVVNYPKEYYGEYKLYVSVSDNLGNTSFLSLDKIFKIDTDLIRISLNGEDNITIIKGQNYKEEGAKAYKGSVSNGGRISEIKVMGEVNSDKVGTYYITYSSGEGDLLVSVTRKVVVKSNVPYIAIVSGLFILGTFVIIGRLFIRRGKE